MFKNKCLVIGITSLFLITGCSSKEVTPDQEIKSEEVTAPSLYKNEELGIEIANSIDWKKTKEDVSESQAHLTFENGKIKAILSMISTEKTFSELQEELKVGGGKIEIIEETENYLSFRSLRNESIRSDIYLMKGKEKTAVLVFMTPNQEFEVNESKIHEFKNNVIIK